jgi:AcrR family transcriptional regulator
MGTSTMAVYTWFGSKQDLMRGLHREGFARFGEALRVAEAGAGGEPLAELEALGGAYRRFALDNPAFYEIMFGRAAGAFTPSSEDLQLSLSTLTVLIGAVARCVAAGLLAGEPGGLALQIWAAAHGAVSLELAMRHDSALFDAGAVYDATITTLLKGMSP